MRTGRPMRMTRHLMKNGEVETSSDRKQSTYTRRKKKKKRNENKKWGVREEQIAWKMYFLRTERKPVTFDPVSKMLNKLSSS